MVVVVGVVAHFPPMTTSGIDPPVTCPWARPVVVVARWAAVVRLLLGPLSAAISAMAVAEEEEEVL